MKEKSITSITLKKINKGKVYLNIYRNKATSKQKIVQELQMGLSTVSQNLNLLEQEGLIERNGYFESTGGRKAHLIQIIPDAKISIGVGILKDLFHIVAVNLYGETIQTEAFPVPYQKNDTYYTLVTDKIKQFIIENHYRKDKILGISIASQGIISPDGSHVTYGSIMGNTNMQLSDFADRLPYPCRLEHDSAAAAYLELWNHPGLDHAAVILLNRNLGGAVITNHSVHHGDSMCSGAIEHLCVDPDGPACYCGNNGCLESYCSVNALEKNTGMTIKEFFSKLRTTEGSSLLKFWKNYLENLASAIKTFHLIVDSPVILSGYLAPYLTETDMTYLLRQINTDNPFPIQRETLLLGTHGQYTPAIGAALFYSSEFIRALTASNIYYAGNLY